MGLVLLAKDGRALLNKTSFTLECIMNIIVLIIGFLLGRITGDFRCFHHMIILMSCIKLVIMNYRYNIIYMLISCLYSAISTGVVSISVIKC